MESTIAKSEAKGKLNSSPLENTKDKQRSRPMTLSTPTQSYANQDVYVGIDVHQRTYKVHVQVEQTKVKSWSMNAEPMKLVEQLQKHYGESRIHSAYEAGFSGYVLHRVLKRHGIDSQVVHPASIEVAVHNRVKTDKRDAQKIAIQLAAGRLRGIRIPDEAQEGRRLLSRTRSQLVKERARLKIQLRMKAHQFGLISAEERREMSHHLMRELLAQPAASEAFTIAAQALWQIWQSLDEQINRLTRQLKQQANTDPSEATYRSAPAVGPVSARILANELGDMQQFANERQLFSYTGLTPSEQSSGEHQRKGHITRQGNAQVRGVLIEVAWRAIRKDESLAAHYRQLLTRMNGKKAIVAVARKLIGRLRAAFSKGEPYQFTAIASVATAS